MSSQTTKIKYTKLPKNLPEQISLLKERGLIIDNEEKAEKILSFISYSRLSNYWYPLLKDPKEDEIFKDGAKFETAFKLYQFDSDLRAITFHAIEQLEVAIRTQLVYHLSHKYKSGYWFEKQEIFKTTPQFVNVLNRIIKSHADTKQDFILKFNRKYQQPLPPSWKVFEVVTFTTILTIIKGLKNFKDLIPISRSLGLHHSVLTSWIETLVYIRNICAHHTRLWNIKLTISPVWLKSPKKEWVSKWDNDLLTPAGNNDKTLKVYAVFCIIIYCMESVNPYNKFGKQLITLLDRYEDHIDLNHMGFPENWKNEPLWARFAD